MLNSMKSDEAWKNFNLGQELHIAGAFIYTGLRRFYEMRTLDHTDELFEFLYNISVGLERLLKIAVVFLEHNDKTDQEKLEQSLITHNHLDLLKRVRKKARVKLSTPHNEFLALLGRFYTTLRYDRLTLSSVYNLDRERKELVRVLSKRLQVEIENRSPLFATPNETRYRKYVRKVVTTISSELFDVIRTKASELNLYTYELRDGSKAQSVFLSQADLPAEEVLWKELLIFLMNTKSSSGIIEFLRSIEPLDFDPELANDYLACFQSDAAKAFVVGELETLYGELDHPGERLKNMDLIANPNVCFDSADSDEH